jgi:hypothetical protein
VTVTGAAGGSNGAAVAPGADDTDDTDPPDEPTASDDTRVAAQDDGGSGGSAVPIAVGAAALVAAAAGGTALVRRNRVRRRGPDEWTPAVAALRATVATTREQLTRDLEGAASALTQAIGDLDDAAAQLRDLYADEDLTTFLVETARSEPATLASAAAGVHELAAGTGHTDALDVSRDAALARLVSAPGKPVPETWHELDDETAELLVWAASNAQARVGATVSGGSIDTDRLTALHDRIGEEPSGAWLRNAVRRVRVPTTLGEWVGTLEVTARVLTDPEAVLLERVLETGGDTDRLRERLGASLAGIKIDARLAPWRDTVLATGRAATDGYAATRAAVRGVPTGLRDVVTVVDASGLDAAEYLRLLRAGLFELACSPLETYERLSAQVEAHPAVRRAAQRHSERIKAAAAACARARASLDKAGRVLRACETLERIDARASELERGLVALDTILVQSVHRDPMHVAQRRQELSELRGAVSELLSFATPAADALRRAQRTCERLGAITERLAAMGDDPVSVHPAIAGSINASRDLLLAGMSTLAAAAATHATPSFDWSVFD